MGGLLRPTLADEIHVTGVPGVVATKFVAFVIAATVAAVVVHGVTGEALAPAPVRARAAAFTFVAGFMLAMQASSAYKRFKAGMDAALELEEQSLELMRHACMIFDKFSN